MQSTITPLTPYQRVKRSKAKAIKAGGRRAPDGILTPAAVKALDDLLLAGYATSALGVVAAALLDAQRKVKRL